MKLYIIIGIPGSGKSTRANKIAAEYMSIYNYQPKIFEADMYFIDNAGNYNFDCRKLGIAHKWCYSHVETELQNGNTVIVSNTSLTRKERKSYIALGKKYNAEIEVITCTGNFKNIHGVPEEKFEQMKKKFQPFTEDELY